MNRGFFIRASVLIGFFAFCLYSYLDMQNVITALRIQIPELTAKVRKLDEENARVLFEIETFESPENLMQLAQRGEFAFLKFPACQDVLTLEKAISLPQDLVPKMGRKRPQITLASVGSN